MQVKASLNNLRMAPRKVRLTANLIKGMSVSRAKNQLAFLIKKPAPLILKLINSAAANAKNNFDIQESDLFVESIVVEAGQTLKRWMPRAMGRASAIRKRTCAVKIVLEDFAPGPVKKKVQSRPEILKEGEVLPEKNERAETIAEPDEQIKPKAPDSEKPYGASGKSKDRRFSRQTFGNIKKIFRRKSI